MINFVLEAEKLMAATAPGVHGRLGLSLKRWRRDYGRSECVLDQRDFIAEWLKRLASRVKRETSKRRRK